MAPPPPGSVCEVCDAKLTMPTRCGLCLSCRFLKGNPFRPGVRLLAYSYLKSGTTKDVVAQLAIALDVRTGRVINGCSVEVRCLRVDAPEWRYEVSHCWPNGISLFVEDTRVMLKKPDAEHDVDDLSFSPGPLDLSAHSARPIGAVGPPLHVRAAITAPKGEQWALGIVLVQPTQADAMITERVEKQQASKDVRMQQDLERIGAWVTAHRPDRVSKKDTLRCVEPPVLKLVCCTSLMRIECAARGARCEHLQCFDLGAYVHTMRNIPPKHAWCCPICDKPAPLHQLRLDAFAQSVLDDTADNVTEVLVADTGKWEVSAMEDPLDDDSSDYDLGHVAPAFPPNQANLQQAALNLGRAFSASGASASKRTKQSARTLAPPHRRGAGDAPNSTALVTKVARERSRSTKRQATGRSAGGAPPVERDEPIDKMQVWEKLQGIEKPKAVVEETRFGWLPEKANCAMCNKAVVAKGGVYCGRKRFDGACGGCFQGICWKCMNKGSKDMLGSIKTTKSEFTSLGAGAWWMHERCMTAEDKSAYFGEEDDDVGKPKDADDSEEEDGKFAWE